VQLDAYISFWENLSPATLPQLEAVAVEGFKFTDPFNTLTTRADVSALLARMFAKMQNPKFVVTGRAVNGDTAYLRWVFTAKGWRLEGMSEVVFGPDGRAVSHADHWDAASQVYEKIPLLGSVLRLLKRFA